MNCFGTSYFCAHEAIISSRLLSRIGSMESLRNLKPIPIYSENKEICSSKELFVTSSYVGEKRQTDVLRA